MRNILALLALSSVACGGSVSTGNDTPNNPDLAKLEGSYELTIAEVTVTGESHWPGTTSAASKGKVVRVDIAKTASAGYEAVVTPVFGGPAKFAVAVAADALTLTGEGVSLGSAESGAQTTDRWQTIVIARDASGAPIGAVSLAGNEDVFAGDVGWSGPIIGKGTFGADVHAPELRADLVSPFGPSDALLPWDSVVVDASEPVARAAFAGNLQPGAPVAWASETDAAWPGVMTLVGRAKTFDVGSVPLTLTKPLLDLAGNARSSYAAKLKFLPVAAPTAVYDFEAPIASSWNASVVTSSAMGCVGGCLKIGPVTMSACGTSRGGVAVRVPSSSSVAVLWRMVVDAYEGTSEVPSIYGSVLSVDVATPGHAATTTSVPYDATALKPLDGSTSKATGWITTNTPVTELGSEIGVTLRAGAQIHEGGCDGLAPAAAKVTFYVNSIVAE